VVCVESCPKEADYYAFICRYDITVASTADGYNYVAAQQCMYQIETRELLNRCLPTADTLTSYETAAQTAADAGVADLPNYAMYSTDQNGNASWFNDFLGDLYNLRGYIFGFGLGVALGTAFLYMHILRIPYLLFTIIWTSILGLLAILVAGTILLDALARSWSDDGLHSKSEIHVVRVFEYIGIAICVLYTCLVLVMRERIGLAIGIVKAAAKAMDSMHLIVLVPLIQAAGLVIFMVFWVIYCFFLASSGDLRIHTATYEYQGVEHSYNFRTFEYKPAVRYAFLFMLFAMFWTSEFIVAIGQLVIALCFAGWYFTRDKTKVHSDTVFWVSDDQTAAQTFILCSYGFRSVCIEPDEIPCTSPTGAGPDHPPPPGHRGVRLAHRRSDPHHPGGSVLLPAQAKEDAQQAGRVPALLRAVLPGLPGALHPLHQQARVHHHGHLRVPFLQGHAQGVLAAAAQRAARVRR
jgi:hypothetical protein